MQLILTLSTFVIALFALTSHASLLSVLDSPDSAWYQAAKRAVDPTSCPTGYKACSNLGAPGLCCANSAVCAADMAGHVACCPSGASCTGSIASVISSGTIPAGGAGGKTTATASAPLTASPSSSGLASTTTATSGDGGLIVASGQSSTTTTNGASDSAAATTASGFIIVGSSTAATLGSNAVRNAQTPLIAQLIISLVQLLPL